MSTGFKARAEMRAHLALYRDIQPVVHHGDLFRLRSPFESQWPAAAYVSKDGARCVVFAFCLAGHGGGFAAPPLRLAGLDAAATYAHIDTGEYFTGDGLMHDGLALPLAGDHDSVVMRLHRLV